MGKTLNLCIANAKGCPNLYYSLQLVLLFIYQTAEPMEVSTTTTSTRPMETTVVTTSQGPVPVAAQPEAPTAVPQREEAEEPAVAQETHSDTTGTDISDPADVVMLEADEEDVTFLQEVSSGLTDPVSTRMPSSGFQLGVSIDLDALRQGPSWRWSRYLPELQPQYPPREDGGQGIQKTPQAYLAGATVPAHMRTRYQVPGTPAATKLMAPAPSLGRDITQFLPTTASTTATTTTRTTSAHASSSKGSCILQQPGHHSKFQNQA